MAELPAGTITFLFTDIEGSTRLWEREPETMRAVLARHDALVAACIEQHGGTVVRSRGEGDSFFAVFVRATEAVAAASALQRALVAERWPAETPIRVRAALNTGEAELRDGDYYSSAVNRCARLRAIAHGGQTLLSQATCELARDTLPPGVTLRDLGTHRLKDLQRPERVFQLLHPDLPAEFPPLSSLDAFPNNLPRQLTSFVGREQEISDVKRRLAGTALLTLTGPGGTGKTRLALQAAADLLEEFPGGVFFVALAPVSDPDLVASTIAQTIGVREVGDRPLAESLKQYLRDREMLLVLDNFEQVLPAAPLVTEILAVCPRLKVLVTSRAALRVRGEQELPVPPMALPDPRQWSMTSPASDQPSTIEPSPRPLSQYAAVSLFIQRARDVKPDFAVTNENAPAVAELCGRLDGLPLAIELAAARVRLLPPEVLLARMGGRTEATATARVSRRSGGSSLQFLTGGARDLPERQQTLRAAIAWSYDLLEETEKRLFCRLSVFVGGCTVEAAEAVCANDDAENGLDPLSADDVLDGMSSLVDKSLLVEVSDEPVAGTEGSAARFRMLETIREYAWECLMASGAADALRRRHARCFLALAEQTGPDPRGADQARRLGELETEHHNLRAALAWCLAERSSEARPDDETESMGLRLAAALRWFWYRRGHWSEGRRWLESVLARVPAHPAQSENGSRGDACSPIHDPRLTAARTGALTVAGILAHHQGDGTTARLRLEEALALHRALDNKRGVAWTLNNLGNIAFAHGDYERARCLYAETVDTWRELDNRLGLASALHNLAAVARQQAEYDTAFQLYQQSLPLWRELGDQYGIAAALDGLGVLARFRGELESARGLLEESLALRRSMGDKPEIVGSLNNLALVALCRGDLERALGLYEESLELERELGDKQLVPECLEGLAGVATARGQPERAARLFGAAAALREEIGAPLPPFDRAEHERRVASAVQALGEPAYEAAWSWGRAMSFEAAVVYALGTAAAPFDISAAGG